MSHRKDLYKAAEQAVKLRKIIDKVNRQSQYLTYIYGK